jgi:hypothetical protein
MQPCFAKTFFTGILFLLDELSFGEKNPIVLVIDGSVTLLGENLVMVGGVLALVLQPISRIGGR